jgi:hypothetical protein
MTTFHVPFARFFFCLSFSGEILGRFIPMMAEKREEDEEQSKKNF